MPFLYTGVFDVVVLGCKGIELEVRWVGCMRAGAGCSALYFIYSRPRF